MNNIGFAKMVASGNDFVIIDAIDPKTLSKVKKAPEFAREICDRKYGAGADGLVVLERSKKADFRMRILNPDGSEPDMCGNGARCAALLFSEGLTKKANAKGNKPIRFETGAGLVEALVNKDTIKLKMTDPKDLWANIDLNIGTQFYKVHYINTGVPHAVFFVNNTDTINLKEVGRQVRFHKQFQPEGANANAAQVVDNKTIKIRTYERGVEDETLACGTGSVAAALLSHYLKLTSKMPISAHTKSGEILKIYFDDKAGKFTNVWLEGSAKIVYQGNYCLS